MKGNRNGTGNFSGNRQDNARPTTGKNNSAASILMQDVSQK
ncbi:MAG: hypothetical protein WCH65_08470 [bacterium]